MTKKVGRVCSTCGLEITLCGFLCALDIPNNAVIEAKGQTF